ncbi:glycosyltransferase family 8 protein [Streptomyces violascens]|uniref:glycosyltransferase family 8 protein n=1 Tax=Streptomyces violascens TaxID=67381 RepID=UPI0037A17D65
MYAIGMCVDEGYLLPSLVTLTSVADGMALRARQDVAVRVLSLDLSRQHAEIMAAVVKRCGFGSFDIQRRAPSASSVMADSAYITVTTYLRFQFTPQFADRPHLVYVDADVLVTGDLAGPLHELPNGRIGAVRDEFNPAVGTSRALPGLVERWPHLYGRPYFNAGMLWMPTAVLGRLRDGVEAALVRGRRHILHNDQDALNLWLLSSGTVHPVAAELNRFEIGRFLERGDWVRHVVHRPLNADATVLHFVGGHKPWQASCPVTESVRDYRAHAVRTLRLVRRLGDRSVGVAGGVW